MLKNFNFFSEAKMALSKKDFEIVQHPLSQANKNMRRGDEAGAVALIKAAISLLRYTEEYEGVITLESFLDEESEIALVSA